jgi:hypothetical protein
VLIRNYFGDGARIRTNDPLVTAIISEHGVQIQPRMADIDRDSER